MGKLKIRFSKEEDKKFLVDIADMFHDDVNIYDGHNMFDAKDVHTVGKFILNKVYSLELLSNIYEAHCELRQFLSRLVVE